jgi:fructokinase
MALAAFDSEASAIHIGTLALALTPLNEAVRAVIDSLSQHQILMVDPNARPSVMAGSETFTTTLSHSFKRADVIKVSGDDLEFLYPTLSGHEAAQFIQESTGAAVLFTDGSRSVEVHVGDNVKLLDVPQVSVVDTVGAGDSFSGGFLAHWSSQDWNRSDLHDIDKVAAAAQFGIEVAGVTCQKLGAQPPFARELSSR